MSLRRACSLADLPAKESAIQVDLDGTLVAVVRDGEGELHAIEDECSHGRVCLSEGVVEGREIECWLHGGRFDLRTGHPTQLPPTADILVYPLQVDGDDILVDVDHPINHS